MMTALKLAVWCVVMALHVALSLLVLPLAVLLDQLDSWLEWCQEG